MGHTKKETAVYVCLKSVMVFDGDQENSSARHQVMLVPGANKINIVVLVLFAVCGAARNPNKTMKSAHLTMDVLAENVTSGGV